MNIPIVSSFAFYLVGMLAIGIYFYLRTKNISDYVLGGRQLGGTVAALSAGASDMSGWLLLGLHTKKCTKGLLCRPPLAPMPTMPPGLRRWP